MPNDSTGNTDTGYPEAINAFLDEKPGKSFTWELVSYDKAPSKFGKDVVIATFSDEKDQLHALWLSATVLVSQFARLKPEIGEQVSVTYLGLKGENSYKNYSVACPDRPPFKPDWDALGDEDGDDWGGPEHG